MQGSATRAGRPVSLACRSQVASGLGNLTRHVLASAVQCRYLYLCGGCAFSQVGHSVSVCSTRAPFPHQRRVQKCKVLDPWRERLKMCGFPGWREAWRDRSLQPGWPHGPSPWLLPAHACQCWLGYSAPKIQPNLKSTNAMPWAGVSHVILR